MGQKSKKKAGEPERARVARRRRLRVMRNDTDRLDRLATELPGATAARPFSVAAASVIPVRARALRCLRCDGELEPERDAAEGWRGQLLRRVDLRCRGCHAARTCWFKIEPVLPS